MWYIMFKCDRCGCCCRSIGQMVISCQCACNEAKNDDELHPIVVELASFPFTVDQDGCCPQLDKETNSCKVYYNRPKVCNTESMWIDHWSTIMTRDDWYKASKETCTKLQEKRGING